MALIEKISCQGPGTHSVLAKDSWQVLKVNASHENDVDNLRSLYRNIDGGMAISLLVGRAVLIVQSEKGGLSSLQTIDMVRGTSYYVPEKRGLSHCNGEGERTFWGPESRWVSGRNGYKDFRPKGSRKDKKKDK